MGHFYSNEIVFRGHLDKVSDRIRGAILDAYLSKDSNSRCGIKTIGGKGKFSLKEGVYDEYDGTRYF